LPLANVAEEFKVKGIIPLRGAGRVALSGVGRAHVFGLSKAKLALRPTALGGQSGGARNSEVFAIAKVKLLYSEKRDEASLFYFL
jgi:hypothetical protein